jgi:hypothetical protein
MILGDSCIAFANPNSKIARFQVDQQDREFVQHLWDIFDSIGLVGAAPRESSHFDKRTGGNTVSYAFATFTFPYFTELHTQCYHQVDRKNVKVLPSNIGDLLTPVALTYWLCGDAHYRKGDGRIVISTDSFTPAEVEFLRSILLDQFHIESSRVGSGKGKEQYAIYIPKREVPKVQQLVKPHIPSMMAYRVGLS